MYYIFITDTHERCIAEVENYADNMTLDCLPSLNPPAYLVFVKNIKIRCSGKNKKWNAVVRKEVSNA